MGFSAIDGLPMATRCGGLDPHILLFLLKSKNADAAELETILNQKSGLLGLSGISGDMRVLKAEQGAGGSGCNRLSWSIRSSSSRALMRPCWADLMLLCSLPASAKTMRSYAQRWWAGWRGWGRSLDQDANDAPWPAHLEPRQQNIGVGDTHKRGIDDRPAYRSDRERGGAVRADRPEADRCRAGRRSRVRTVEPCFAITTKRLVLAQETSGGISRYPRAIERDTQNHQDGSCAANSRGKFTAQPDRPAPSAWPLRRFLRYASRRETSPETARMRTHAGRSGDAPYWGECGYADDQY